MQKRRIIRNFWYVFGIGLITFTWGWYKSNFFWGEDFATNILYLLTWTFYYPIVLLEQSPKILSLPKIICIPLYIFSVLANFLLYAVLIEVVESSFRKTFSQKQIT
jgi:hypothetical protein